MFNLFAQCFTYFILKITAIVGLHNTLIDDAEYQHVIIGSEGIASQRRYACDGTCLSTYVKMRWRVLHAFLKCSILARYRQGYIQIADDARLALGINQQFGEQLWCNVIIQRQSATICNLILACDTCILQCLQYHLATM